MATGETGQRLSGGVMAILVGLTLVWGANMAAIKIGSAEMAPIFMAAVRSAIGAACILAWMLYKGIKPFPDARTTRIGVVMGLLFASEFTFVFLAVTHTLASRVYILLYTAPFFVAVGAHFLLKGDRLSWRKSTGLTLAFAGVVVLFAGGGSGGGGSLAGDLMALAGGMFWALTTLYIKRYAAGSISAHHTLFFQVGFSIPVLLALSLLLEDHQVTSFSWTLAGSLAYQGVIVVFLSYLMWFYLILNHPASLLHSFSSLTPVVGVFISGVLILGEPMGLNLGAALVLVCLGLWQVNR